MSEVETYTVTRYLAAFDKFLAENQNILNALKEKLPLSFENLTPHRVIQSINTIKERISADIISTEDKELAEQQMDKGIWVVEHFANYLDRWPFPELKVHVDIKRRGLKIRQLIWEALQENQNRTAELISSYVGRSWMHLTSTRRVNTLINLRGLLLQLRFLTAQNDGNLLMLLAFEMIEHPYRDQSWFLQGIHPTARDGYDETGPPEFGTLQRKIEEYHGDDLKELISIKSSCGKSANKIRNTIAHSDYGVVMIDNKPYIRYQFRKENTEIEQISFSSLKDFITRLGGFIHTFGRQLWSTALVLAVNNLLHVEIH